jgi:hypothetical protein
MAVCFVGVARPSDRVVVAHCDMQHHGTLSEPCLDQVQRVVAGPAIAHIPIGKR